MSRQCHQQKLRDMQDSSSVLWHKSWVLKLKLALHSDSMATILQHTKMGLGRMKHVELRFWFVKDLLERERLTLSKIPGTKNPADIGTKVLDVNTHRPLCWIIGLGPAKQAVEEIKGNQRSSQSTGSVGVLNVWKGLRTWRLGLAHWAQGNSTSMNLHELRI